MTPPRKEEGTTKVRFELWLVLSAIVMFGMGSFAYLNAEQRDTKQKQQEVIQRVVRLEANSQHIITQLDRIAQAIEKVEDKLETHRTKTEVRGLQERRDK